jgi:hypothetical protein
MLGEGELLDRCYCGKGVTNDDCRLGGPTNMGNPQGPCVEEFAAAAEGRGYDIIEIRLRASTFGLSWAVELLGLGHANGYCLGVCSLGLAVDECTRCVVGEGEFNPSTATCPLCIDPRNCDDDLVACVAKKCASNDVEPCLAPEVADPDDPFKKVAGPCATEIAAVPTLGKLNDTRSDLRCRAQNCAGECFKP